MSEQWFWKHRGEIRGPYDTEDVASLIRQRRVFDRDQLKLEEEGEWISGQRVKEMFKGPIPATVAGKVSSLSQASSGRDWTFNLPQFSASGLLDFFADRIAFLLIPVLNIGLFFCNRRVLMVSALLLLALAVGLRTWNGGSRLYHSAFRQMMSDWDELEALRVKGASDAEWAALRDAALPRLGSIIKMLQDDSLQLPPGPHEVGSRAWKKDYTSRKLLTASQSLREVLNKLPQYDLNRTNFVPEMNNARDLLTGAELRVITEPPQKRAAGANSLLASTDDKGGVMMGIVVVDAALILAGAIWYFRSRR